MIAMLVLASHLVFGLAPEAGYEVRVNGVTQDTVGSSPGGVVSFEFEGNGQFQIVPVGTVPPAECPDLTVTAVQVGGATLCVNGPWIGRYKITNVGTTDAPASVTGLTFTPPGGGVTVLPNQNCPALAAGSTSQEFAFQIASSVPANASQYLIGICADKPRAIQETSEDNNCY